MNLRPIRKKRLSESAIDEIKNFIFSNDLQEGDQLPSERVLVQKLQISRSSIREALRMLEITGLIEVKPGKGIFRKASCRRYFFSPIFVDFKQ